jgi:hypothetical protein
MANTPARYNQADVARALRANLATGEKHTIEIDRDGTIRLVPVQYRPPAMNDDNVTDQESSAPAGVTRFRL